MNRPARAARSEPQASEAAQPEPSRVPPPSVTRDEIDLLIRRAGLTLNAGQKADLAVSFQHLVTLAAKLPRARPFADEPAFVFRPASPEPPAEEPARKAVGRPAAKAVKPAVKPAKPKPAARPKGKPKAAKRPARPASRR